MTVSEILRDRVAWMPGTAYEREKPPLVSVLLPTFCQAKNGLFEKAVRSVLHQQLRNLELIIVDDCSTDGTAELIRYFMEQDVRVSCIRHTANIGLPAISEYEAYLKARGTYVAFIFDADEWDPDYLEKMVLYARRTGAKAMFAEVHSHYGNGPMEYIAHGTTKEVPLSALCTTNMIANGGVVLHREVIETIGLYDPHLSLAKTCDWDLWRRIVTRYEFHETGIFSGTEYKITQDDSLGNSMEINRWIVLERMSEPRGETLLPTHFGAVDVTDCSENATAFYRQSVEQRLQEYAKKGWYQKEGQNIPNALRNNETPIRKYVLVVAIAYNATTMLSFERIASQWHETVFLFLSSNNVLNCELLYADMVVFLRDLTYDGMKRLVKSCEAFKIPMFYYADDNFIELAKDFKKDQSIQKLKRAQTFQNLVQLEGVFLSTPALVSYFEEIHLHRNPILLEPVIGALRIPPSFPQAGNTPCTFAFMGGFFRRDIFSTMVLPALCALSRERPLRILCPKDDAMDFMEFTAAYPKLEIVRIPRDLSLNLTLQRFGAYAPQFLIHCGPDVRNNAYKTENALINATQLGAVLIASDVLPFSAAPKGVCLLTENTVGSWERALAEASEKLPQMVEVYQQALSYCQQRYSAAQVRNAFSAAVEKIHRTSMVSILARHDALYNDLAYYGGKRYHGNVVSGAPSRSLTERPLSFTGGLSGARKYKVRCPAAQISELGICFSCYGEPHGEIQIVLSCQDGPLREMRLNCEEYVRDGWTYLEFEPLSDMLNRELMVTLMFHYAENSSRMGVFEDATRRTFWFKVFNKLGRPLPGKDVLFVDFQ